MGKKMVDETLVQIEETQKALRQSIDQTRQLAEQSDELIRRHRQQLDSAPATRS